MTVKVQPKPRRPGVLFGDAPALPPCPRCAAPGTYCPKHGNYNPATSDPEVLDAVAADARTRNVATRVIRKPLQT